MAAISSGIAAAICVAAWRSANRGEARQRWLPWRKPAVAGAMAAISAQRHRTGIEEISDAAESRRKESQA